MIILGFPGVGKSTLAQKEGYQDSDSSLFSWAPTSRTRHPEWPDNYLDHLEEAAKFKVVLASTHAEVRKGLVARGIPFTLVYPSLEMKREYIQRYVDRGSSAEFIELLESQYEKWIRELMNQEGCEHFVLTSGQYLSDILEV